MERGVAVTKYGKKGLAAQRVLFLDAATMSAAWRDPDSRSPGHRRTPSLTKIIKGQRESLPLAHLIEVYICSVLIGLDSSCMLHLIVCLRVFSLALYFGDFTWKYLDSHFAYDGLCQHQRRKHLGVLALRSR